jgi:hypothetical protein
VCQTETDDFTAHPIVMAGLVPDLYPQVRIGQLSAPPRGPTIIAEYGDRSCHPGEGRDLFARWAPAFAGVARWMTPLRIRKIDEKHAVPRATYGLRSNQWI